MQDARPPRRHHLHDSRFRVQFLVGALSLGCPVTLSLDPASTGPERLTPRMVLSLAVTSARGTSVRFRQGALFLSGPTAGRRALVPEVEVRYLGEEREAGPCAG
jgi:hypothetical protein